MIRKFFLILLVSYSVLGCSSTNEDREKVVYVYSWGDYIAPEAIEKFTEETGIKVILDEFETNESMFPRVAERAVHYDVICPSDYMVQKLISNNLLQPLNFEKLPNARKYISSDFFEQSKTFDPENKYSLPYCWGIIGIIYDATKVLESIDSWTILWNKKYKDEILMQDSARDALMIPLKIMGRSLNESDKDYLIRARDMLIEQKLIVQGYFVDESKDKLISGEAIIGVVFSGDALRILEENKNMKFIIPKEGTNLWIDSWVITKDAENIDNAHKFIDFMCQPEIALINFKNLGYSMPIIGVREMLEAENYENISIAFPESHICRGQETYKFLGNDMDKFYNRLWMQVKIE